MQLVERHLVKKDHPSMRASMPPPLPPKICTTRRTTRFVRHLFTRARTCPMRKFSIASSIWTAIRRCLPRSQIPS